MATWRVDEGLAALIDEWKKANPGAVVYTIADSNHATDPDVSQHAPDGGGSQPGDDKGEVDAGDFMPGKSVTDKELDDLAEGLRESKDKRLLYVIRRQRIFSSTVQPWTWRPYSGKYHGHTHVSVNDKFDANTADWKWENEMVVQPRPTMKDVETKFAEYRTGMEDAGFGGYNHIARAQALMNVIDSSVPDVDCDGVYGAKTARKLAAVMAKQPVRSSTNGSKLYVPEWKVLYGVG